MDQDHANKLLDDCEMGGRAWNVCKNMGLRTLGDLATRSMSEVLKFKNAGQGTARELSDLLVAHGLWWSADSAGALNESKLLLRACAIWYALSSGERERFRRHIDGIKLIERPVKERTLNAEKTAQALNVGLAELCQMVAAGRIAIANDAPASLWGIQAARFRATDVEALAPPKPDKPQKPAWRPLDTDLDQLGEFNYRLCFWWAYDVVVESVTPEQKEALAHALLTTGKREAWVIDIRHRGNGVTFKEIARHLGVSATTAGNICFRAYRQLRHPVRFKRMGLRSPDRLITTGDDDDITPKQAWI